jgi:hypothetical protein
MIRTARGASPAQRTPTPWFLTRYCNVDQELRYCGVLSTSMKACIPSPLIGYYHIYYSLFIHVYTFIHICSQQEVVLITSMKACIPSPLIVYYLLFIHMYTFIHISSQQEIFPFTSMKACMQSPLIVRFVFCVTVRLEEKKIVEVSRKFTGSLGEELWYCFESFITHPGPTLEIGTLAST